MTTFIKVKLNENKIFGKYKFQNQKNHKPFSSHLCLILPNRQTGGQKYLQDR